MRTRAHTPIRSLALAATIAALAPFPSPSPSEAQSPQPPRPEATRASAVPSCNNSCRGLGIDKVRAGDEHCGLVPRETKDRALDAACGLAESHRETLQRRAEEKAREKCAEQGDHAACLCRTELRAWQNVYTHVLSKNCWTECGWAFLIECERRPDDDG